MQTLNCSALTEIYCNLLQSSEKEKQGSLSSTVASVQPHLDNNAPVAFSGNWTKVTLQSKMDNNALAHE